MEGSLCALTSAPPGQRTRQQARSRLLGRGNRSRAVQPVRAPRSRRPGPRRCRLPRDPSRDAKDRGSQAAPRARLGGTHAGPSRGTQGRRGGPPSTGPRSFCEWRAWPGSSLNGAVHRTPLGKARWQVLPVGNRRRSCDGARWPKKKAAPRVRLVARNVLIRHPCARATRLW
jgi:hypothetical protein